MKKHVAILGSTGSIGTQALEVIQEHPDKFEVEVLAANNNAELLIEQAVQFVPNVVVIGNTEKYKQVADALENFPVKVYACYDAICQVVEMETIDMVLTAMVGFAGLLPTIRALQSRKHIALANKETLVVAGELITRLALEKRVNIFPVDSEHSAIFQCLAGEEYNPVEKILLTASGGPFRNKTFNELRKVTAGEALIHPNWCMGQKVTIDSASMMNKGLEAIEAKWLFEVNPSRIEVVVHPQSVIHSMVQFEDGSVKAQLGVPDMKLPIQYALSYPQRLKSSFPRLDFTKYPNLTFEQPDTKKFRNLALAFEAMEKGGNAPCVLNASNEVAVEAFLCEQLGFTEMSDIIEKTLQKISFVSEPSFEDYTHSDKEARQYARSLIGIKV